MRAIKLPGSRLKILFFFSMLGLFFTENARAYPEFIGYKYTTCITCHYNGQGNGPLNDYGRAIWSAEIAGRAFAGNKSDEQLGESSGFLGKTKLPWWLRPGIKGRELVYQVNPGRETKKTQSIIMQADANVALLFSRDQSKAFVGSIGYAPTPQSQKQSKSAKSVDHWISREHYFRWQATKNLWLYAGMLDKVYGIRIVNHTAYSRMMTGVAQNDQSHSIIAHYIQPNWEWTVDSFFGNLYQDKDLQQKGFSTMYEYELKPAWRVGFSALNSKNKYVKNTRYAIHSKNGLGNGSSILFEFGFIDNKPMTSAKKFGYYIYSEAMQRLTRGYHLFITGQAYKDDFKTARSDNLKAGAGILAFPMARMEFRLEFETARTIATDTASRDTWAILSQLHISL